MKINSDKKAQLGETMTWVVATLIVIVVLGISIAITSVTELSIFDSQIVLEDKQKDLVATKSIVSFLSDEQNSNLVREFSNNSEGEKIVRLLNLLPASSRFNVESDGGWNLEIKEGDEILMVTTAEFLIRSDLVPSQRADSFFEINLISGDKLIKFWEECFQGLCR